MPSTNVSSRQCKFCEAELNRKQLRFCSRRCDVAFRRQGLARNCRACQKEYWRRGSVFCSAGCRKQHYDTRKTRVCPRCKNEKLLTEFHFSYCLTCFRERDAEKMTTPKFRWQCGKATAKKRDLEWSIPFDEYPGMLSQNCHYCHGPLDPTGVGLDRKDSSLGYTLDNVVPCCGRCNRVKSDVFSYEQMLRLGVVIREFDVEEMALAV